MSVEREIDPIAKYEVEVKYPLPSSLHLPIAARDKHSITRFIGDILLELSKPNTDNAFLVSVPSPIEISKDLPIWKLERSEIFHRNLQVWVHVDYRNYRRAYKKAFPGENIDSLVLNHVLNRRVAVLKGMNYLRLVPVSREVNSSSALSEKWMLDLHKREPSKNENYIKYAGFTDLLTMLNIMPGGGVMDTVREAYSLIEK